MHTTPNSAWLSIRRDVLERLLEFKMRHGTATWDETLDRLLETMDGEAVQRRMLS